MQENTEKIKKYRKDNISEIYAASAGKVLELPEYLSGVSAGFPSPADDYIERQLDLNEHLIHHPSATFYVRIVGDSMINAGMNSGDLIIVDRALEARNNSVILAVLDGEFTVKRLNLRHGKTYLIPENPDYQEIEIREGMDFEVWGVVTNVIHQVN